MKLYLVLPSSETRIKAVMLPDEPDEADYRRHRAPGFNDFMKANSDWIKECKRLIEAAPFVKDQQEAKIILKYQLGDSHAEIKKDHPYLIDGYQAMCGDHSCNDGKCENGKCSNITLVPIAKEEPKCNCHPMCKHPFQKEGYCRQRGEPVESADNATAFKRWTLEKWGKQDVIMDNGVMSSLTIEETCEKLNELEALKMKLAEPTEGNGGWISVDSGNPKDSEYYLTVQIGSTPLIALFVDSSFYWGGNMLFPDYYQPLPDTTKLTNE